MLRVLLSISFIGLAFVDFGQTPAEIKTVDSLKALLPLSSGIIRYEHLYKIAYELFDVDNPQAVEYATKANQLAVELGDSLFITKSGRIRGQLLRRVFKSDESIAQLIFVLPIARRNGFIAEEKLILNAIAITYLDLANYDKALEYHFQSLEIREKEGNLREISMALNNIGLVYYKISNFEMALEFYSRSLEAKKAANDSFDLDRLLINTALCYNTLHRYNEAQSFINEAFKICGQNCNNQIRMEGEFGLGLANLELRKFEVAKIHLIEAISIARNIGNKRFEAELCYYLARVSIHNDEFEDAKNWLTKSEILSKELGHNQNLIFTYKEFSNLYDRVNDFEKSSNYRKEYIQLKDSIYSNDLIKNLANVQAKYEERANLKTIQEKEENIQLQNELISRQRLQYFFIVLVAFLIIVLAMVLLWANRRQHVHNTALSDAKRVIEDQNKQLTVTNEELDNRVQEKTQDLFDTNETLIQVNDELDNFVYRTSHDLRGPLVTLKGVCNVAMLDVKDELAQDYLKRLDLTAAKLNAILTRLLVVNQVNHTEIEASKVNLMFAIDEVIAFEKEKGIPSRLKIDYNIDSDVNLISDIRLVKMILENLIDNSIKFYNTSDRINPYVTVKISKGKRGNIRIYVEDNGIGINSVDKDQIFHLFVRASERSETGGIGLYLTKLAAQRLGGGVKLLETSDKGSKFLVLLPGDINPILAKRKALEEQRLIEKARRERERKDKGSQEDDEEDFI